MAEPTIEKTWRFNINRKQGTAANLVYHQQQMLDQHKALSSNDGNWDTVPASQWSVDHSCDGSVAGTPADGIDRWSAVSDLIWDAPGDPHSWVIYNTGLNGGLAQVKVDLDNNNSGSVGTQPESISVTMSWGGLFTGGTTTDAPTATDESVSCTRGLVVGEWFGGQINTGLDIAWHMMMSDDGKELRIFYLRNHVCFAAWIFGELNDYPASLSQNMYGSIYSVDQSIPSEALHSGGNGWMDGDLVNAALTEDGGAVTLVHTNWVDSSAPSSIFDIAFIGGKGNETEDEAVFGEIGLWDTSSAGFRGPKGRLKDIWVVSNYYQVGATFPADGRRRWHKVGAQIVVPWDGTPSVDGTIPENIF